MRASLQLSLAGLNVAVLPKVVANRHIFNQYVIRTPLREELRKTLEAAGVSTEIYYPVPMHLQECFAPLGYKIGSMPESESAANETLALPIYPELHEAQARYVVDVVRDFFQAARPGPPRRRPTPERGSPAVAQLVPKMIGVIFRNEQRAAVEEFFELFKTPWEPWRPGASYHTLLVGSGATIPEGNARLVVIFGAEPRPQDAALGALPGVRQRGAELKHEALADVLSRCTAM
jgi:hypothetical protein